MKKTPVVVAMASLMVMCLPGLLAAQPLQDSVTGSGSAGTGTFTLNAVSGASGENARGSVAFNLAIGTLLGSVSCLNVVSNEATVGGSFTETSGGIVNPGDGYIVHVRDGIGTGDPDLIRLELLGPGSPNECGEVVMIFPSPVTSGDLLVVDAVAPVTLETLLGSVEELALPTGVSRSLTGKLEAALAGDRMGNIPVVCGALRAFISEVQAIAGRGLSLAEAENLVSDAETLQTEFECAR